MKFTGTTFVAALLGLHHFSTASLLRESVHSDQQDRVLRMMGMMGSSGSSPSMGMMGRGMGKGKGKTDEPTTAPTTSQAPSLSQVPTVVPTTSQAPSLSLEPTLFCTPAPTKGKGMMGMMGSSSNGMMMGRNGGRELRMMGSNGMMGSKGKGSTPAPTVACVPAPP